MAKRRVPATTLTITLLAEQDDLEVRGNAMASGDDRLDRQTEDEILERLEWGDVWAWAHVVVEAACDRCGKTGCDSLGAVSAASERDFVLTSVYYSEMVANATLECRKNCECKG